MCNFQRCKELHAGHVTGATMRADLVSSTDEVEVVFLEELGDDLGTERERDAAVVLSPANHVLVWVGPQQVTQQALVRHVCRSHDTTDLLH